ncbi:2-hydroxyacyl-CoA dehydratase [Vreelandella jeotgali]|uniref:2-hydroxyacyl-CoA dehydratase n=1 Tax=Vreelandella jeotgali TaxID=553386 RepID=UPI00034A1E45|nr:2-hydroxyacyl-CoA dehydratase [Halomonas jeotgali]
MRYNQVRDLVVWAADYHGRMSRQFSDRAGVADSERLQMALDYLAAEERRMKAGLDDVLADESGQQKVLNTWFDDPTDFPQPPELEHLAQYATYDSIESAMETATQAHKALQRLYEYRAEKAAIPAGADFFRSLAEGHEAEVRRIVSQFEEFNDL